MVTGGLDCMLILWDFKKEKVSAILTTMTNLQFCSVKVGWVFGGFLNAVNNRLHVIFGISAC